MDGVFFAQQGIFKEDSMGGRGTLYIGDRGFLMIFINMVLPSTKTKAKSKGVKAL